MSEPAPIPVVFDCGVFAQALMNPKGPAGACLAHAQSRRLTILITQYILQELRELPQKLPPKFGVTPDRVEGLINDLSKYVEPVENVPHVFDYPRDPDDAHYVDLAIVTNAMLITTRDRDLLDLMRDDNADGVALRGRYPALRIVSPPGLLAMLQGKPEETQGG